MPLYPPAVFIMGPTASGKSALAVQLAQQLKGEIISVDSALVYKGMDIGTAKPTLQERCGISHHLIDILDPIESFSTGQFRSSALTLMAEITARGHLPVLVGGTMLYFKSLTQGIAELPEANLTIRAKLDDDLRVLGKETLHRRLAKIDPESAARIHLNDPQRVQRALEVYELTGIPLTHYFGTNQTVIPYQMIKLIIAPTERFTLHQKIAHRFLQMIDSGFIEEVEKLFQRGDLSEQNPSIRCVGYRQAWAYLKGEYTKDTMIEKGIAATRQLAKRQFTWLRKETDAISLNTDQADLYNSALTKITNQM